ncbi:ABC transporter ATP-binding protein [Candidatus Saccharibacteria bacterium]|nr:ABC transporter ATP-binding protein [Candidatus Saccharibacteria bacterium]
MANQETIIELQSLSKRYGFGDAEYYALRDFDLTVKRGEFIMIMGPSGCGKTTLLNIIGLIDKPTSGQYLLGNRDVSRISSRRQAKFRARQIGFIFQNFNLIPTLPIIENVALPLVYSGFHKYRRLRMASNILDHFHLQEREYYMPWQLSGGQQQRVAIARSLVANPSLILADEPTGNLDSRASHIVMEELRDIHSLGNTIIMVTHNPALTTYATRVINMLDGQIDTDIKTVADRDLPKPGDPEKIAVRVLPRKPDIPAPLPPPKPAAAPVPAPKPELKPEPKPVSISVSEVEPAPKPTPKPTAKKPAKKTISVKVEKTTKTPKKPAAKKTTKKTTPKKSTKKTAAKTTKRTKK